MKEDNILKLEKSGQVYDLSDEVGKFLESKGLFDKLEDKNIEVEIDESKGQSGMITRLTLVDGESKPKEERPSDAIEKEKVDGSTLVVKELTVGGVSVDKAGVIFKEEENVWYTLDSTINAQKFKDECTKKMVEVMIAPQDKGNDVVKGYVLKEEEKKEEKKDPPSSSRKSNNTGNSIEAQASLKCAKVIVASMVDKDSKPEEVLRMITQIAHHSYKTIQDLKNKD